ncbi:GspH/FimT family pseudopilin [Thioalkalivibrio sp. AKL6]|uniref:GspH/FimT family pseudopilin n=1 Tax=Thioalkalivibrio sp. AKL6 TaxID=1158154 RepID=UPI00037EC13A|nr:GspH/FimT family pseudopilin [Thioalkalivibrio sp. AKL6]
MTRPLGFTLIELMITLAVLVILATIAVPGFQNLVENNRTTTQTNELVTALNSARSEAIKQGVEVSVTASGNFASGWCVHAGDNCSGDNIIRQYGQATSMSITSSPETDQITFDGRGAKSEPAGAFTLTVAPEDCPAGASERARQIQIVNTGRVSVSRADC